MNDELLAREVFRSQFDDFVLNFVKCDRRHYVDKLRDLANIQFESEAFSRTFELDLRDLKDFNQNLSSSLLTRPLRYLPLIEYAIKDLMVLQELSYKQIPEQAQQIYTDLQNRMEGANATSVIDALPDGQLLRLEVPPIYVNITGMTTITPLRSFSANLIDQMVYTQGIVIQATKPSMKATHVVVKCKDCGHCKHVAIPLWRAGYTLPRQCDSNAGRGDGGGTGGAGESKCSLDPYRVASELCGYIDVQRVKLQELTDDAPTGEMPKHLSVHITGTLVGKMSPGNKVKLTGVYTTVEATSSPYLHALGVESLSLGANYLSAEYSNNDKEEFHRLANQPNIHKLITDSMAPAVYGSDDVKLTLACQLFGGCRRVLPDGSSIRGDIHILLMGDPSTAKSQLLKFVEKVSPVSVYTSGKGSSAAGLTAALVRDSTGCFALEGGAMVLADGGVVCIDEFDKMRDTDRVSIHEAMEQQTISIAKAGITCMLATECAVLAAANPTFGTFDETKDASEQHNFETTILSRFDAVWLILDKRNKERDQQIASHVLKLHGDKHINVAQGPIAPLLLKKYLLYCRTTCHPTLTASAAKMLETYYVDVRERARQEKRLNGENQIPITVRQLESITRLAEALAKMELQATVNERHVVEAMRLFNASTIATNSNTVFNTARENDADPEACRRCEQVLLDRIPINSIVTRRVLVGDLQLRNFTNQVIGATLAGLAAKGILEECPGGRIKRVNLGRI